MLNLEAILKKNWTVSTDAKQDAGYQLFLIQTACEPTNWKPMSSIGQGVKEIRIKEQSGEYRVLFVASIGDKVYVLRCFQKKTQKTSKLDIDIAKERYQALVHELNRRK